MTPSNVQGVPSSYLSAPLLEEVEGSSRPRRSIKRPLKYFEENFLPSLEEKVGQAGTEAIKKIKVNVWTPKDEDILRLAVERDSRAWNKVSFARVAEDPDVYDLGRTSKQLREKWINNLSPDSLGGSIQESHKPTIEKLYKTYPRKWEKISEIFARTVLEDKAIGKYYSGNTIKNYFNGGEWKKNRNPVEDDESLETESSQEKEPRERSSSATTIESKDKVPNFDELFADENPLEVFAKNVPEGAFSDDEMSLTAIELNNLKSFA